jgi:hypothetical protein
MVGCGALKENRFPRYEKGPENFQSDTEDDMKVFYIFSILFLFSACGGNKFSSSPSEGGSNGTSEGGTPSGGTSGNNNLGGTAGTSEGGTPSGGASGNQSGGTAGEKPSGGTAGQGGAMPMGGTAGETSGGTPPTGGTGGTPDPCTRQLSCQDLLDEGFVTGGCTPSEKFTRGEFINFATNQVVDDQFEGYADPANPHFADVGRSHVYFGPIEEALWLRLIPESTNFRPDSPAQFCWATDIASKIGNLPDMYAVWNSTRHDRNVVAGTIDIPISQIRVLGTSAGSRLDSLRVVNNLNGNFSVPQNTIAVTQIKVVCPSPSGGEPMTNYNVGFSDGQRNVSLAPGCYDETGDGLVVSLSAYTATVATQQEFRLGFDPESIQVRGDDQSPIITVKP